MKVQVEFVGKQVDAQSKKAILAEFELLFEVIRVAGVNNKFSEYSVWWGKDDIKVGFK